MVLTPTRPGPVRSRRRAAPRLRLVPTATAVSGLATAYLVARDGSPPWQVARVVVVTVLTVASVWAECHYGRRTRASVAYAVGVLALVLGAGIGGPSAAKEGLSAGAVAGLACLVAGATLLVAGVAGAALSVGWIRRILLVPTAGLAAALAVLTLFPAVYVTNVPHTSLGTATPGARGLTYRDVRFPATDGVELSGWYVPSRNRAAVALLHGAGSTRSTVLAQAALLARHGYGVLLYDARGHGRSAGRAMDYGWYGDRDIAGAVSFLSARADVNPRRIGVVGMSKGGEEAIGAAASDERIHAVVAEGSYVRTAADMGWLSEEYGVRGWLQEQLDAIGFGFAGLLTDAPRPVRLRDAVRMTSAPVLLVAAGKVHDEAVADRWIQQASPRTVSVWVVPGAAHTQGLHTRPGEWEARVVRFLDHSLAE